MQQKLESFRYFLVGFVNLVGDVKLIMSPNTYILLQIAKQFQSFSSV